MSYHYRNHNGALSYYYQYDVTLVMKPVDIDYLGYKATSNLYTVYICICPYTKDPDIMAVMNPLFNNHGFVILYNEVIFQPKC